MSRHADGLVCYRENPHIDARAAGKRGGVLLRRCLLERTRPRMHRLNPAIIWPPTGTGTADSPMRDLEVLARRIEREIPDVWAVNVVAGFAFADAHDAGVSFSIVGTAGEGTARTALERLAAEATRLRDSGYPNECNPDAVIRTLGAYGPGPVILVEPSDNVAGGAPGDGTGLLRALLQADVWDACVVINDPAAVTAATSGEQHLSIGGKGSALDEGPVALDVALVGMSDGRFELEDVHSHLAASQGRHIEMGPCAVVQHRGITILLTSRKTPPFDLGQLRSQGIEPTRMRVIGVKAAVAHRRAYDPIATASFTVATPGPCTSNIRTLPYRNLRRPIYPLDMIGTPG
jgi:microcystin degradation protein MlrC